MQMLVLTKEARNIEAGEGRPIASFRGSSVLFWLKAIRV